MHFTSFGYGQPSRCWEIIVQMPLSFTNTLTDILIPASVSLSEMWDFVTSTTQTLLFSNGVVRCTTSQIRSADGWVAKPHQLEIFAFLQNLRSSRTFSSQGASFLHLSPEVTCGLTIHSAYLGNQSSQPLLPRAAANPSHSFMSEASDNLIRSSYRSQRYIQIFTHL